MHFISMKTLLYVYLLVVLASSAVSSFEILERSFRTFSSSPARNPRKTSNEDPSFEILEQKFNVFEQNRFNGKNKQKQQLHQNSKLEVSKVVDDSLTREPSFEILEQKFNVITPRKIKNLDQQYKSRSTLSNVAENNAKTRVIGSRRLENNEHAFKSRSTRNNNVSKDFKTKVITPRKIENLEKQLMSRSTSGNNASKDFKSKVIAPRRLDNLKKQFKSYSTSNNNAPKDLRARVIARRRLENFENELRSSSSTDNIDNEFKDSETFGHQKAARYSASKQFEPHVNTKEKISTSKKPRHDENVTRDKRLQNDQQIIQAYQPLHNKNSGVSSSYHFHNSGTHSKIKKLSKNADSRIGTKDLSIQHGTVPVQTYRRFGKPIIIRTPMVVRSNQPSTMNDRMVEKKYMHGKIKSTNQPSIGSSKTLPKTALLLKNKSKLHNLVKKTGQRRSPTSNVFSYHNKLHHNSEKEESVHTYNESGPHRQDKPHPDEIKDTYRRNANRAKTGSNKISIYSENYNSKPMYSDNDKSDRTDNNKMYEDYSGTARFILKNTMQKYMNPYRNQKKPPSPITILEEIIQKRNESSLKESEEKIVDYYERLKHDIYNILTHLGNKSMINDAEIVTNIDPTEYMMNDVVDIIRSFVRHESDKDVSEEVLHDSAKLILKYIMNRQKIATNEYETENSFVTPAPLKSSHGFYESNRYLGNIYPSETIETSTAKQLTRSMFGESNRKLQPNNYHDNLETGDRFLMYNKMGTKNSLYNNKHSTNQGQLPTHRFKTNLPSEYSSQLNNLLDMAMQNQIEDSRPIRVSEKHHPIHAPQETAMKASRPPLYPIQSQIDYYNEPFPYHTTTRKPPVPIHSQIGFYNAPSPYIATTRKPPVFKTSTRFTNLRTQFTTASPTSRLTKPVRLTNIPSSLFNGAHEITPNEKNSQKMDSYNVPTLFRPNNAKISSNQLFKSPFKSFMGEIANYRPGKKQGTTALQPNPTVRSLEAIAGAGALALMAYGISHAIPALAAPAALLSPLRRSGDSRHNRFQDRNHNRSDKQNRKPQPFVIPRPLTLRDASSNDINKERKFVASNRMPLHTISQIMKTQNRQTAMGSKVNQAALAISEDKRKKMQAKKYQKKSPVLTGDLNFGTDPVKENKHFGKVSYSYDNLSNNPSYNDEVYVEKDQDSPYTEVIIKSKQRKRQENAHRGQQTRSDQLDRQPTRTNQIRSTNPTNRVRQTRREHNNRPISGKRKSSQFEPLRIRSINPAANSVKELLHKIRPKVSDNMFYLRKEDETNEIPYEDYNYDRNDVITGVIDRNDKQSDSKTPTFENHLDNHRVEKTYKSFFEKNSMLRKRMSKVSTTDPPSHEDEMKVEDVFLFEYYDDPENSFDEMQTSGSSINREKIPKQLLRQLDYDEHSIQSMHDLGFNVYLVDSAELELGRQYSLDSTDYIYASVPENNSYDDCEDTNECNGNELDEDSSKSWRSIPSDSASVNAESELESRNSRSQFKKSNRDHLIDSESSQNQNNFEENSEERQYHQIDSNFFTPKFSHLDKASSKKKRSSPHKKHPETSPFSDFQPYFPPVNYAAREKPQHLEPTYDPNNLNSFRDHWANAG